MVRHEDIGPEIKRVSRPGRVDRVNEIPAETRFQKEWALAVATERQRVGMAGHVPPSAPLAASLAVSHAFLPIAKLRLTLPPVIEPR